MKKKNLRKPIVIFCDMDGCISPNRKLWFMSHKVEIDQPKHPDGTLGRIETHESSHLNVMKPISDHDSGTISLIRRLNQIELIFISGDDRINRAYAERQSIPFIFTGRVKHGDKWEYLKEYWQEVYRGQPNGKYVYIGDSIPDYHCLMNAGVGFVPADMSETLRLAFEEAGEEATEHIDILGSKGGEGILEEALIGLVRMKVLSRANILKKLGVR